MRLALDIGISVAEFWELTPYELRIFQEVRTTKKQENLETLLSQAWLTGYYSRVEKLPSLKSELEKIRPVKETEEMTEEQILNQIKVLNMAFGGEVNE